MANRLPSAQDLGVVEARPVGGVAQFRGETGLEGAAARGVQQAAGEFGEVSQYLLKAQDEQDRMAAEDALNKYRADLLKRRYDEKEGWEGQLGEAATNPENIKRHLEYLQKSRDQIGSTLSVRARRYFQPQAEASRMHSEASFYGHVSTQRLQQEVKIFEAGQQLILDGVSRAPLGAPGDELMRSSIDESTAKGRAFFLRRGFSPEEATAATNQLITNIVATRIEGALNANRADEAKRIYDENEKLLGQKGRMMAGKVNDAFLKHETMRIADAEVNRIVADVETKNAGTPPGGITPPEPEKPGIPIKRTDLGAGLTSVTGTKLPNPSAVKFKPDEEAAIARHSGGDPAKASFLRNVVSVENAGFGAVDRKAVSPAGAAGMFQIWEPTGRKFGLSPEDRFDIDKSAAAMARYYDELHARYGGNRMAMAADYNGGPAAGQAVMRGAQPPRDETRNYLIMFAQAEGVDPNAPAGAAMSRGPGGSVTFQTSRVRDLQEELKTLDARVTTAFEAKFGKNNPEGLQMALQRARSALNSKIQAENGIQQGNLNEITTTIINNNIDNFGDLQSVPGMREKLRTAGPYIQHITSLMNMVGHQKSGAALKGDAGTYFDLTSRVVRGEITNDQDLLPFLMNPQQRGSKGIDMAQFHSLQQQISRVQRPETRDHEKNMQITLRAAAAGMHAVAMQKGVTNMGKDTTPEANAIVLDAIALWEQDARSEIMKARPEDAAVLFDRKSPSYIGSTERLARAFMEARERIQPVQGRMFQPSEEEKKAAPVFKNEKTDGDFLKFPAATPSAEGWKGGYFRLKGDPPTRIRQKLPETELLKRRMGSGG